jgi:hypothetical protein
VTCPQFVQWISWFARDCDSAAMQLTYFLRL